MVDGTSSFADQRGLNVTLDNDVDNRPYSQSRELTLNVRNSEFHTYGRAISAVNDWNGATHVNVSDTRIRTYGASGHGVVGYHDAVGDIYVNVERVNIVTKNGVGIWGIVRGGEKEAPNPYSGPATVELNVKDSFIQVAGTGRGGLYASHYGSGEVNFRVVDNSRILATDGAYGVVVFHRDVVDEDDDLDISIDLFNSKVESTDSYGILVYRQLNPNSTGTNRITIGGTSHVRTNGTTPAILAQGNTVITINGRAYVSAESDHAIQIPGGNLVLHIEDGGRVDGLVNTDAGSMIEIRDGSKLFARNGEVLGTGFSGIYDILATPATNGFTLNSQIAPRAAVYESLPGVLLRLDESRNIESIRLQAQDKPTWLQIGGSYGTYKPSSATIDGRYTFRRYALTAGTDFSLNENLNGWIGARMLTGSAGISSPTGGGRIETLGLGPVAELTWENSNGFYASGGASLTWHDVDYSSASKASSKNGADARILEIGLEAGRHLAVSEKTRLTYRTWLGHSDISMNEFTDAFGSRVAFQDADRRTVGLGVEVETKKDISDGEKPMLLRGSLGIEKRTDGNSTTVRVFDKELMSKGPDTRLVLGASATWNAKPFRLHGAISSIGLGTDDRVFTASLTLRKDF